MAWEVEFTDEFCQWWNGLQEIEQDAIDAAVEILEERGPALGRELVDSIHASRHTNMKELRPLVAHISVLFLSTRVDALFFRSAETRRRNGMTGTSVLSRLQMTCTTST